MGKDSSDIIRYFFFKNTPNIIPILFPLCEVGFIYSGIVQMCTPCPGTLNRRAGTISTPLYTFSLPLFNTYMYISYVRVSNHHVPSLRNVNKLCCIDTWFFDCFDLTSNENNMNTDLLRHRCQVSDVADLFGTG